jgi:hypothetical protein
MAMKQFEARRLVEIARRNPSFKKPLSEMITVKMNLLSDVVFPAFLSISSRLFSRWYTEM